MNMKRIWLFQYSIILANLIIFVAGKSFYTVIAPGTIKSNRKYSIAVTLHTADEPCTLRVSIEGPSLNFSKDVYVRPFESKLIEFMPQKLVSGDYKLIAEGISGIIFRNETDLWALTMYGPNIYIQTDKAFYKANDLVQFRVVILDEHTRPLKIKEPIRIEILDGMGNRVKQFKDITLTKGVYTGQFLLSQRPVEGEWHINVIISGKYAYMRHKVITVQKYVLPKFSVELKCPSNILREDRSLKVGIYGKYTYGKYVAGQVTVELWDPINNIGQPQQKQLETEPAGFVVLKLENSNNKKLLQRKQIEIETVGFVEFHFENSSDYENLESLTIEATFTENLTGITQSAKRHVNVRSQRYNIKIPTEEIEFRNNKPHRLKAYVEQWSGAPARDDKTPVVMKHGNKQYESFLDTFGIATFDFDHQSMAEHVFIFNDSQRNFPNIYVHERLMLNQTEYYCRLRLIGDSLRLGNTVEIEVSSIQNIPYFVYTVMGHGAIIAMELIMVPDNQKSFIIRLTPSIAMVPTSFIYVHYIQNGNLRYEELELKFPEEFENQVSLTAPKEVGPGEEVTIEISAEPNSYVSILAVDLSVSLLDSSYDLNKRAILDNLDKDRSYLPIMATLYPGVVSGVLTLTNAHYSFSSRTEISQKSGTFFPENYRFKFPETWIFKDLEIHDNSTQLTLQIPHTITSWRITAFSNNDIKGFGMVKMPTDITTIQPFFVRLNLPYSVKRGEIVAIPIIVFNYLDQSVDTEIIMFNENKDFQFMKSNLQETENSDDGQQQMKQINVANDGGKTIKFYITPLELGDISLKILAKSPLYSDAIEQKLKVEPEGVIKRHNKAVFVNVPAGESFSSYFSIVFPKKFIPGSEYITLSVGGDYMVPTLGNLENLVHLPTGCGEQNMVHFAPDILILQYLKVHGRLSKEKNLVKKIRAFIDIGYQQQLSFRHREGGYSVFGEHSDSEPSNWLTAYVVRFMIKSIKYSPVEARIIEADLDYLAKQQLSDGAFPQSGYLFSPTHQNKYGFTAFVLLAFLEDSKYAAKYEQTIQKGLEFLNTNLEGLVDVYSLSIVAYTLKIAKDKNSNDLIEKLKQRSNTNANGLIWWSANNRNTANDVEITAYALMALLETVGDHTPILKWLIQQRNARGGFKSTMDTVVGLQALVKFSEKHKALNTNDLSVKYHDQDKEVVDIHHGEFKLMSDNALIMQQHELPKSTRHISFEVNGFGYSLIQLSYQYNIVEEGNFQHFLIKCEAKLLNPQEVDVNICFTYQTSSDLENSATNMIIMEVNLPSGFRSDAENDLDVDNNELIQRIESKNSDSTIVFYFDNVIKNVKNCFSFAAERMSDVIKPKPAAIIIYDYYNLSHSSTEFYTIQK